MKRSRFTEEQIAYAMCQVESETPAANVCREVGVSEATVDGDDLALAVWRVA